MNQNYYVYKLYNSDYPEFYIGSTKDMKDRKRQHKYSCTNPNSSRYNFKVYKYIRSNGGYSSWSYEILEHITTSINKYELHDLERKAIQTMKPSLNCSMPNRDRKEYDKQYRQQNKAYINEKLLCECGKEYTRNHKARHEKSKVHRDYINQ